MTPSPSLTRLGKAVLGECTDTNITMPSLCLSQLSTDKHKTWCNHFLFLILHIIHKHFAKFSCALQYFKLQH